MLYNLNEKFDISNFSRFKITGNLSEVGRKRVASHVEESIPYCIFMRTTLFVLNLVLPTDRRKDNTINDFKWFLRLLLFI